MWAHWVGSGDDCQQQRQVFLTKNSVLCSKVKRSFTNMGLAWRKRSENSASPSLPDEKSNTPKFMTSQDWLVLLDEQLPGEPFFTEYEREQRRDNRKEKDTVSSGIDAFLSQEQDSSKSNLVARQEMTFVSFRKLWRKIESGSGSQLDAVLVWREIQSFIKGSVMALHIELEDREEPKNRLLSMKEYLALREY
jgi:hypothetical protein